MLPKFYRIFSNPTLEHADDFSRLQSILEPIIESYTGNPLYDNVFLEDISVTATTNLIEHKLDRKIRGYVITKQNADVTFYWNTASTADLTKHLPLVASGVATISLVVF